MRYLLRLDLQHVRHNLEQVNRRSVADEDLLRELAARGVWRHSDDWWGGDEGAVGRFAAGEILQKLPRA